MLEWGAIAFSSSTQVYGIRQRLVYKFETMSIIQEVYLCCGNKLILKSQWLNKQDYLLLFHVHCGFLPPTNQSCVTSKPRLSEESKQGESMETSHCPYRSQAGSDTESLLLIAHCLELFIQPGPKFREGWGMWEEFKEYWVTTKKSQTQFSD